MNGSRVVGVAAVVAIAVAGAVSLFLVQARGAPLSTLDPLLGDDPTTLFGELAAGHTGGGTCARYGSADVDPIRAKAVADAMIAAGLAERPMVQLARAWGIREDKDHLVGIGAEFQGALVARGGPYDRLLGALNHTRWSIEREQLLLAGLPTKDAEAAVPAERVAQLRKIWAEDPGLFGLAAERAFVPVLATATMAPRIERVKVALGRYAIGGGTLPYRLNQLKLAPADLLDFAGEPFTWQPLPDGNAQLSTAHGVGDASQLVEIPPVSQLCTHVEGEALLEADLNGDGVAERVIVVPDYEGALVLRGCPDGTFAFAGNTDANHDLTVGVGSTGGWTNLHRGGDHPGEAIWNGFGWWVAPE